MGPDPVPERGVELIIRPIARMAGRRHSKKHSQKHRFYLMKTGTCMRTFHVAQVSIHRDVSWDSDVQPMLKNLVMRSTNYDGSEVALFLDETSHNLCFISGPFSLSNSRCRGKVGVDTSCFADHPEADLCRSSGSWSIARLIVAHESSHSGS